jgi:Raf kinase inhibitor-like YbhB/YbcL family protein
MPRPCLPCLVLPLVLWLVAGCGAGGSRPAPTDPDGAIASSMTLSSPAFAAAGTIPTTYTCDGAGISPPLAWSGTPAGATELAVTVVDPDAPGGIFIHWVLLGLAPTVLGIPEGGPTPDGAHAAAGGSGRAGYVPPCPPKGQRHRYRFSVFALRRPDGLAPGIAASQALAVIRAAADARGVLIATYGR